MDDYGKLSAEAKQAWQRGYDLAHPRKRPPRPSREPSKDRASDGRDADISAALEVVGGALEGLNDRRSKSVVAVDSGSGVHLVVMEPMSVEAVMVELDNMKTDECREALGDGFLRGMIVKAKAARAEGPEGAPTIN
ncbi:MAG: hypothetical protein IH786_02400 [Proteobacteria bacterium]|nr:hypothetical protein [Pseudomonadota bacterium]